VNHSTTLHSASIVVVVVVVVVVTFIAVPASASGQPLPNCGYLPARLQPLPANSKPADSAQPTASCLWV
jgi:hypothetical protein